MQLRGRTAVITGAAGGIGSSLAWLLAQEGVNLALVDRDAAGIEITSALANGTGLRISAHVADIADQNSVAALAAEVLQQHDAVDLLINNAGVALAGRFDQIDQQEFEWVFATNFWGVVRMTRAFLPSLHCSDDARIVNISSLYGLVAPAGATAYAASKFAVRGFSQSLRAELAGSSVGVIVVIPGGVATSIAANAHVAASLSETEGNELRRQAGRHLKLEAADAAARIIRAIKLRRDRFVLGNDAHIFAMLERLMPVGHERLLNWASRKR